MNNRYLFASALLAVSLIACSRQSETATATGSPADPAPAAAQPEAPPADPGALPPVAADGAVALELVPMPMDVPSEGQCSLDAINGIARQPQMHMAAGGAVLVGGWIAGGDGTVPSQPAFVMRNESGGHIAPFTAGGERPDVAEALGTPALANSGFNLLVTTQGVPAGTYRLGIRIDPERAGVCDLGVELVVR
jgi:hypothetical protein